MNFESSTKNKSETTFSSLKARGEELLDKIVGISLPTAILLAALNPQSAEAADVPGTATLDETISILKQASLTENFETAVTHVTLPDGRTLAFGSDQSQTGQDDTSASVLNPIFKIEELVDLTEFAGTENPILIYDIHNHPSPMVKALLTSALNLEVEENALVSTPPSIGFISYGDTARYEQAEESDRYKLIADLREKYDIKIQFSTKVVDALGVWTQSFLSDAEWKQQSPEVYTAYYTLAENMPTHKIVSQGYFKSKSALPEDDLDAAAALEVVWQTNGELGQQFNSWLIDSIDTPILEMVQSDSYRTLIDNYADAGVKITYTLFD